MKKLLLITAVLALIFVPTVSAWEGYSHRDDSELIFSNFSFDYDEIAIGQEIHFTLILTNETDYDFTLDSVYEVFNNTEIPYGEEIYPSEGEQRPVLKAGTTTEIPYTYTIPKHLAWYTLDNEAYMALFCPAITYYSPDSEHYYYHNPGIEGVPILVGNLSNGDEYVDVYFADDKEIFPFYDTPYEEYFIYDDEYYGYIKNYINIESKTEEVLNVVNVNSSYPRFYINEYGYNLFAGETMTVCASTSRYKCPCNIMDYEPVEYRITFLIEHNEYFAASLTGDLKTRQLPIPDVEVKPTANGYQIRNISAETIQDFFVMYNIYDIYELGGSQNDYMVGDISPNEVWDIQMGMDYKLLHVGYYIEDTVIYWDFSTDKTIYLSEYMHGNEGFFEDYYPLVNELEVTNIALVRTEPPANNTAQEDDDATNEDDDEKDDDNNNTNNMGNVGKKGESKQDDDDDDDDDDKRNNKSNDVFYESVWLWIVFGFGAVLLGFLIGFLMIRKRK